MSYAGRRFAVAIGDINVDRTKQELSSRRKPVRVAGATELLLFSLHPVGRRRFPAVLNHVTRASSPGLSRRSRTVSDFNCWCGCFKIGLCVLPPRSRAVMVLSPKAWQDAGHAAALDMDQRAAARRDVKLDML
jgi:hypothetical protein